MKIKGLDVIEVFIVNDIEHESIEAFYTAESALNYIYETEKENFDPYEEDESYFKRLDEEINQYLMGDKSKDYTIEGIYTIMKRILT